jgi:hypothetical protein
MRVRDLMLAVCAAATVAAPLAAAAETATKSGPRVKGSVERRGGYSYKQADTINTYGDSRNKYGSSNSLRDPNLDQQTNSGPFDHGFFFNSGQGLHGGDAPFLR